MSAAETSESRHTLLIPLVGPMQAWGSRSRFDDRDTHTEPTKSGVLGIVCAALGWDRSHSMDALDALRFGIRVDADGRAMTDYHTALEVARAGGTGTSTVTSRRHYLSDARFLAGLEGGDADLPLLRDIEAALRNPAWTLSLGRKSFPLTLPPYLPNGSLREGKSLKAALSEERWRWLTPRENRDDRRPSHLRLVLEDAKGEAVQADRPLDFARRSFGLRRLKFDECPVKGEEVEAWIPAK